MPALKPKEKCLVLVSLALSVLIIVIAISLAVRPLLRFSDRQRRYFRAYNLHLVQGHPWGGMIGGNIMELSQILADDQRILINADQAIASAWQLKSWYHGDPQQKILFNSHGFGLQVAINVDQLLNHWRNHLDERRSWREVGVPLNLSSQAPGVIIHDEQQLNHYGLTYDNALSLWATRPTSHQVVDQEITFYDQGVRYVFTIIPPAPAYPYQVHSVLWLQEGKLLHFVEYLEWTDSEGKAQHEVINNRIDLGQRHDTIELSGVIPTGGMARLVDTLADLEQSLIRDSDHDGQRLIQSLFFSSGELGLSINQSLLQLFRKTTTRSALVANDQGQLLVAGVQAVAQGEQDDLYLRTHHGIYRLNRSSQELWLVSPDQSKTLKLRWRKV